MFLTRIIRTLLVIKILNSKFFNLNVQNLLTDFSEFIMACSLTSSDLKIKIEILKQNLSSLIKIGGKPKDNLALAFEIYDSNMDGILERDEMQVIIEAVHELYEGKPISTQVSKQKVDLIMNKCDQDQNGAVSKSEFIEYVSNDPKIRALLNSRQDSNRSFQLEKLS